MSQKTDSVDSIFPGYNCAQTLFKLFASDLGVNENTALKIASGFGSGMACAETCGAVTGSYMVIGLKHGHVTTYPDDKVYTKSRILEFNRLFREKHGSLKCKDLTGYDISTPEGLEAAREAGVFMKKCPEFIKTACKIIEDEF
jgi:C_GCAxxG_C_C family probable redox protein